MCSNKALAAEHEETGTVLKIAGIIILGGLALIGIGAIFGANNADGFAIFLYIVGGLAIALGVFVGFLALEDA